VDHLFITRARGSLTKCLNSEQHEAVTHIYEYGETLLIGQMGAGKTIVALTAMQELLRDGVVKRALVFAPPNVVADVWPGEYLTWDHTACLNIAIANGSPGSRKELVADLSNEIIVLSYNNMDWFFTTYGKQHGFDMVVFDEITKLKAGGAGFKKMRKCLNTFDVRVGMSGTPVSESFEQLFYQVFAIDGGKALGRNKTKYMNEYFVQDYNGYSWDIKTNGADRITDRIAHLVYTLPDYTDELPPLELRTDLIELDTASMDYYLQLERDSVNSNIIADNAAILVTKLQQVCAGFAYHTEGEGLDYIHDLKTERLLQCTERPLIVVYQFAEELKRLRRAIPEGLLYKRGNDSLARFRKDSNGVLFLHPKSAAHGLDLTCASRMIIASPIWSRDLTRQVIARIWRRNQKATCKVDILAATDTIDLDIVVREENKASHHNILMKRLNALL